MNTGNRKNVYILAFTLLVVMLGFGVVIPIMPFYIEQLGAGGTELGLLVASYAVMRLIFGPIWGGLSDRVGRKPVLMIGILGYAITMIWFGLATKLWMLFAARILSGILSSATSPTTMAYIGDSTPEEERGGGMGMLGAAIGLGTIFGPALGGLLAEESLSIPFFIAGGMSVLALLFIALFLPESLPPEARQGFGRETLPKVQSGGVLRPNPKGDLAQRAVGLRPAAQPEGGSGPTREKTFDVRAWRQVLSSPIGILLLITALMTSGLMIFYGIFGLYALEKYNFGPEEVGMVFMAVGLVSAVGQGALAGPLTKRWGDAAVIKVGMLASAAGFGLMLFAYDLFTVLLTIGFFGLATALLTPAVTALTSKRATMEQGITMGLSNAFMSLGRIVGPLWAGFIFDVNIHYPYLSGAAIMFIGFLISLIWISQDEKEPPAILNLKSEI